MLLTARRGQSAAALALAMLATFATGSTAFGQGGNFDGFGHLIEPQATPATVTAPSRGHGQADPWGPVHTDHLSLANAAPVLLPFFNNAPVFGLPGTVANQGIWNNTQISGDWGGRRTELARNGYFFDVYTTSAYQDLMSGGLDPGDWFVQNTQMSLNIDTGRAGWWDGGLIHFTTQARYGADPEQTFNSGATVPTYTGLLLPDPLASSTMLPSEYFLVQGLSEHTSFIVGKISDVFIPDQTLFGDSYKFYFANFAFNKNPITTNFYNPTAWAVLGVWAPSKQLAFAAGVLDPNSRAQNLATNAFDRVNLYFTAVASYDIGGLPGQFSPAFNWSNQYQLDLARPFGALAPGQIPQAVGALLGSPDTAGLPINNYNDSCFLIANASQYLYVADRPREVAAKLKSGQPPPRGGRVRSCRLGAAAHQHDHGRRQRGPVRSRPGRVAGLRQRWHRLVHERHQPRPPEPGADVQRRHDQRAERARHGGVLRLRDHAGDPADPQLPAHLEPALGGRSRPHRRRPVDDAGHGRLLNTRRQGHHGPRLPSGSTGFQPVPPWAQGCNTG